MSQAGQLSLREGSCDVAIVAGPRVVHWPSVGVSAISIACAEMGLAVSVFGGDSMTVRGVIPLPGAGGIVMIEDVQKRIHRIQARAIVKVTQDSLLPDPFPGWRSQGLVPLWTAERLRAESQVQWGPATAVLGTGNEALRFGSSLLESGVPEVYCIEGTAQWGAKRIAGWEVERRRFESGGGRIIEARPVSLQPRAALRWELRVQDTQGIRVLEVARVVAAGPFADLSGVREHPPGSALFELEQTARPVREESVEGWVLEEERGRLLAGRIVKALVTDAGESAGTLGLRGREIKAEFEKLFKRAKGRLKRYFRHREEPFMPSYQGKWVSGADIRAIRSFDGVPQTEHRARLVASVECIEPIPCNTCMTACPEGAIEIGRVPREAKVLTESKCFSCGVCVASCPSSAIVMMHEKGEHATSSLVLPWRGARPWKVGEFAVAVNRRGESLGNVRVTALPTPPATGTGIHQPSRLVQVDVPTHLLWEVRGLRRKPAASVEDAAFFEAIERSSTSAEKVEITLNGEKRLVRDRIPVSVAFFETGQSRPEDVLYCPDGSCGLCQVTIDGVKKLACRERIHRGMAIRLNAPGTPGIPMPPPSPGPTGQPSQRVLCPCLGVTVDNVVDRLKGGNLRSPEAVLSVTCVGEGRCHGQLCMESFRRALLEQGLDASQWSDWRFPWSEWTLLP
jgi:ferredoxin